VVYWFYLPGIAQAFIVKYTFIFRRPFTSTSSTFGKMIAVSLLVAMFATTSFASTGVSAATTAVLLPSAASSASHLDSGMAPDRIVKVANIRIPIGGTGKFISLLDLATIKTGDFEKISGRKMGWLRRMEFRLAQKKIWRAINEDGTVNSERLARLAGGYLDEDDSFHTGGFALGFFLGIIGVLIAYIIKDDNHHRRVRWAWFGFAIWVVALLLVAMIAVHAGN
jgi:hypothetical protein